MVEKCFAARTKDTELLSNSSSGGVFTELARAAMANGCYVCGAAWKQPGMSVHHVLARSEADIALMRGSKYLPSDIGPALCAIKSILKRGELVAFLGMPCQVAAVGRMAKTIACRDKVLLAELICHGVPDMRAWEQYCKQFRQPIVDVLFKDKKTGWNNPTMKIVFENGETTETLLYDNMFVRAYMSGLCMREGCFRCPFKRGKSGADITIGDFWGIEKSYPRYADNKGASCVLCHTGIGADWFEQARLHLDVEEVTLEEVETGNPNYAVSAEKPRGYAAFWKGVLAGDNFDAAVVNLLDGPLAKRLMDRLAGFVVRHTRRR